MKKDINQELIEAFEKYDRGEEVEFLKKPFVIEVEYGIKAELLEEYMKNLNKFYKAIIDWNKINDNFVKNMNSLKSTASKISYIEDPYDLICDLSLGIMNYHPFNDGNKRSGFVSLLCLSNANSITFSDEQKKQMWSNYINVIKPDVDYNENDFKTWYKNVVFRNATQLDINNINNWSKEQLQLFTNVTNPQKLLNNLNFDIKHTKEYKLFEDALYFKNTYTEEYNI